MTQRKGLGERCDDITDAIDRVLAETEEIATTQHGTMLDYEGERIHDPSTVDYDGDMFPLEMFSGLVREFIVEVVVVSRPVSFTRSAIFGTPAPHAPRIQPAHHRGHDSPFDSLSHHEIWQWHPPLPESPLLERYEWPLWTPPEIPPVDELIPRPWQPGTDHHYQADVAWSAESTLLRIIDDPPTYRTRMDEFASQVAADLRFINSLTTKPLLSHETLVPGNRDGRRGRTPRDLSPTGRRANGLFR